MKVSRVEGMGTVGGFQHPALREISGERLRRTVESLAYPRHFIANRRANREARDWIYEELRCLGYSPTLQGEFDNVIATGAADNRGSNILLGAHYDTVPTTPGADDNNSAIAVCLEAGRVLAQHDQAKVCIAVFNREEDGLLGSREFVRDLRQPVTEAQIFEMVGYFDPRPGSQFKPGNLPIPLPSTGDFIGIVSNQGSNAIADEIKRAVEGAGTATPLVSLKAFLGIERYVGDLLRSDHAPFWEAGIPAIMWTDTSNFRNPNYHLSTDTPDTLDYDALADVTRMVVAHILMKKQG
jgi:Zn-dependent M28 family amino/carboxypeptidase